MQTLQAPKRIMAGAALAAVALLGMNLVKVNAITTTPNITNFTVNPQVINPGQSVSLSWTTTNATSASINQGIGNVALSGTQTVSPTANTTYTLTATDGTNTVTQQATVTVTGTAQGCMSTPSGAPMISSFTANPQSITSGQSAVLNWTTANGTSTSINQGIGSVALTGTQTVSPTATTTYTLTSGNGTNTATQQVTVMVNGVPGTTGVGTNTATVACTAPVIVSFTPTAATINSGQSGTLNWVVTGTPAPTLSINNGVGSVTGTSVSVSPTATTTYTLTATNGAGTVTAPLTLTVNGTSTNPDPSSGEPTLGWMLMPVSVTGTLNLPGSMNASSLINSPNWNATTQTWNTTGNWTDCNGTIDNDPAHHSMNMSDTDPGHHLGMMCNGSAEAWTASANMGGSGSGWSWLGDPAQWKIVPINEDTISILNNAFVANPTMTNLGSLFVPGSF